MRNTRNRQAFTLIELLVGLLVTSIILSALATLAFALSSGSRTGEDTAARQAYLRHTTLHLSELIGKCKLICAAPGNDLAIWRADDNADNRINLNELVYIERGENLDTLRLCQFSSADNPDVTLADLPLAATKASQTSTYSPTYLPLMPDCNNVQFTLDAAPPFSKLFTVSFDLVEDRMVHRYQITAALRCQAAHLLNEAGSALVRDDD